MTNDETPNDDGMTTAKARMDCAQRIRSVQDSSTFIIRVSFVIGDFGICHSRRLPAPRESWLTGTRPNTPTGSLRNFPAARGLHPFDVLPGEIADAVHVTAGEGVFLDECRPQADRARPGLDEAVQRIEVHAAGRQ